MSRIDLRALVVIPARDRIVPPASAEALDAALPHAAVRRVPLGHVGMIVGGRALRSLWAPLANWPGKA